MTRVALPQPAVTSGDPCSVNAIPLTLDAEFITTGDIRDVLEELQDIYENPRTQTGFKAALILGPSGVGKTRISEEFQRRNDGDRTEENLSKGIYPLPRIGMESGPTTRTTAKAIYEEVTGLFDTRGTEDEFKARLAKVIREAGVRGIILDEIHHLVDERAQSAQHRTNVANFLKRLTEHCPLFIFGTRKASALLSNNPEWSRRISYSVELDAYPFRKKSEKQFFQGIVARLLKPVADVDCRILVQPEGLAQLHAATQGRLGFILPLLEKSLRYARRENSTALVSSHLSRAFRTSATWEKGDLDPFAGDDIRRVVDALASKLGGD